MSISPAMYNRLPKAAKDELDRLERQNRELLDQLQTINGQTPPGCNTWVIGGARTEDRPLGRSLRIAFDTKEGRVQAYVDIDGQLSIRGDWSILVAPESGNAIKVIPGRIT